MESKIRLLVNSLEHSEGIKVAHVNPKQYPRRNESALFRCVFCCYAKVTLHVSVRSNPKTLWFIGLEFEKLGRLSDTAVEEDWVFYCTD